MRNPNGYGSVFKLSGNRRKPYAVRKTIGFNEKGYPIYRFIGYTRTREEGLIMLSDYNKSPYNIEDKNITTRELYERWIASVGNKMSAALSGSMRAAWRHCASVYDIPYGKINSLMIQSCIDNCPCGTSTKAAIKNLFTHIDRFALELDVITRSRCLLVTVPTAPETNRRPFTDDEIAHLWRSPLEWADTVLIFIYTGLRISELLSLRRENIDLTAKTITGGTKTAAGKNRIIPIHPDIMPLIKARLESGGEYLISVGGRQCSKTKYYSEWEKLMTYHGMSHTPHECRHTFRSLLDSAGANKRCIDLMMGHKSKDVGERVYTHKTLDELRQAVALIDLPKENSENAKELVTR